MYFRAAMSKTSVHSRIFALRKKDFGALSSQQHNRDGSEAYKTIQQSNEDQSDVSSGRSISGSVAHNSLQEQEKSYANEDAKIAAQRAMEDKLRKQWHAVAQPTVLKSDSAHGSSEIRNFFDDEVSDTELATLSAPGTPVVNGMPLKRAFAVVDLGEKDQSLVLQSAEKRLQTLGHLEGTPVPAKVVSLLRPGIHTNRLSASPHPTENTMPTILGNLNMFPNEVDAHCQILKSVYSTCHEEGVDPFEVNECFYKSVHTLMYEFFMGHPNTPCQNGLHHPAITSIIRTFFETNDVKVFASDIMPNFIEMPIETVAFALTIIHETLSSWKTGVLKQKGQKLSAMVYSQIYQGHVGWIQQWKDKPTCSEEWKKISKDLGEEAAYLTVQFMVFDTN
ncbi:hypothetical protein BS47DRAFT_1357947 [Hydnum rufescens UP504]|uniref:DUF6532 domain-containing protein n=1 Tax=Hydnum rufescens UP504 TaxID=1448309 RepID=A0A9P6BBV8_9AGAM|nr:hypothetical protein BS47DRAFT_1357947 [Hydnum rufescens UP504]